MTKRQKVALVSAAVLVAIGAAGWLLERRGSPARHVVLGGPPRAHASGLVLALQPDAYAVEETERGFEVTPLDAASLRFAWSVELQWASGPAPNRAGTSATRVEDRKARYVVDIGEGGSGGNVYVLSAWTACGGGHIAMIARDQAEPPNEPDWSMAWGILARTSCRGASP